MNVYDGAKSGGGCGLLSGLVLPPPRPCTSSGTLPFVRSLEILCSGGNIAVRFRGSSETRVFCLVSRGGGRVGVACDVAFGDGWGGTGRGIGVGDGVGEAGTA